MAPDVHDIPVQDRESVVALVRRLAEQGKDLATVEAELTKAEAGAIATRWGGAMALLWVSSLLLTALVVVLAISAVMMLSTALGSPGWAVAVVTAAIVLLILVLALIAWRRMKLPHHPASLVFQWIKGSRRGDAHE